MKVYEFLIQNLGKIDLAMSFLGGNPQMFELKMDLGWLGHVKESLEVEIKVDKESMGWLYLDSRLLYFEHGDEIFELSLSKFKDFVEGKVKEKKFSDIPQINHLFRSADGRITTLISVEDLLSIAKQVGRTEEG